MTDIKFKLITPSVPNFIFIDIPQYNLRQDGFKERPKINIEDLSQEQLEEIAEEWKRDLFKRAANRKNMDQNMDKRKPTSFFLRKFKDIWEYQLGSLMLKEKNQGLLWKKCVAEYFFKVGYELGEKEKDLEVRETWICDNCKYWDRNDGSKGKKWCKQPPVSDYTSQYFGCRFFKPKENR